MGTTSQKLEYLNGTKNSLKSAINNLGGDITSSTTFRNYATELNDIYDNLPKISDTGTNVSLNPTLKGRLGIVPKGNTLQNGTPTPSTPVEIQSATGTQNVVVSDNDNNSQTKIINLGNIELNKIGNYEDYIDGTPDNWVYYKNVEKTVITESNKNIITSFSTQNEHNRILINKTDLGWKTSWDSGVALLNKYKEITSASAVDTGKFATNFTQGALTIWNDNFTDLATAQNLLIGTEILITRATTQQTPITDTNLISQLNELYYLQSYNDTTNIDVTGNLPMRITASAIKGA